MEVEPVTAELGEEILLVAGFRYAEGELHSKENARLHLLRCFSAVPSVDIQFSPGHPLTWGVLQGPPRASALF